MRWISFVLVIAIFNLSFTTLPEKEANLVIKGTILDKDSEQPLAFANVNIGGKTSTTNMDGQFIIVVPNEDNRLELSVNYIGYKSQILTLKNKSTELDVSLERYNEQIDIDNIYTAEQIIRDHNHNKRINYSYEDQLLSSYYKETTYENQNAGYIAEGVFNIFQPSEFSKEDVTVDVIKTRKKELKPLDPHDVPMISGHAMDMIEGVTRREGSFLNLEEMNNYDFSKEGVSVYNGREVYIISFIPNNRKATAKGLVYIDSHSKAIIKTEYYPILDNQYFWSKVKWTEEYGEKDGHWELRRVSYSGEWETGSKQYRFEALLVITDSKGINYIPEIENNLAAHAIFFNEAEQFNENFWETNNYVQLTEQEKVSFEEL